jgi:hypothetical protein
VCTSKGTINPFILCPATLDQARLGSKSRISHMPSAHEVQCFSCFQELHRVEGRESSGRSTAVPTMTTVRIDECGSSRPSRLNRTPRSAWPTPLQASDIVPDRHRANHGTTAHCRRADTPPKKRKQPLDSGKRKPLASERLQKVLEELVNLLDREYHYVYNHNLGVQSGTSVIEDVQIQRGHALCSRVACLIAHDESCSEKMVTFCRSLTPVHLNHLQTIFDSFDMDQVTDFLRIRMFNTSSIHASLAAARGSMVGQKALAECMQQQSLHGQPGSQAMTLIGSEMATGKRVPASTRTGHQAHNHGQIEPFCSKATSTRGYASRYEQLRAAGHPFVLVADDMLKVLSLTHSKHWP